MQFSKWLEVKSPFKVRTEISIDKEGTVTAVATAVNIHNPVGILPDNIAEYSARASAKCHPDDAYDRAYGVRLASNRARAKFYTYMANRINERLEELDIYLQIIHEKTMLINGDSEKLLVEQMDIKDFPFDIRCVE